MQVESALVLWDMNDRPQAIAKLADALDNVEELDPATSRRNERAHQFARATVGFFWHKLDPFSPGPARNITIGQASALTGDEGLLGVDLKPLADNWRILALCEIEIGVDMGVERRSLAKQTGPGVPSVEMFIAMARYARAITSRLDWGCMRHSPIRTRRNRGKAPASRFKCLQAPQKSCKYCCNQDSRIS
jgi:hypothetical protein